MNYEVKNIFVNDDDSVLVHLVPDTSGGAAGMLIAILVLIRCAYLYYVHTIEPAISAAYYEFVRWGDAVSYDIWVASRAIIDSLPALGMCIGIAIVIRGAVAIINSTR